MGRKAKVEQEKVTITPEIMSALIEDSIPQYEEWEFIEDKINSVDAEDGGAQHYSILKRIEDERFFKIDWTDWDREDGQYGSGDFMNDCYGKEVFPREVVKIVYE